jgi:uncharacterized protein (DUF1778 family)
MKPTDKRQPVPKKAERVETKPNASQIDDAKPWVLTAEDREVFVNAFFNPPEPNAHMKAAAALYKKRVRNLL